MVDNFHCHISFRWCNFNSQVMGGDEWLVVFCFSCRYPKGNNPLSSGIPGGSTTNINHHWLKVKSDTSMTEVDDSWKPAVFIC